LPDRLNPMTTQYRPYFRIYLVWHPQSPSGQELADYLFQHICADPKHPLLRGLGIPIHFRSIPFETNNDIPRPILFKESLNSATFVLIDDQMVIDQDWEHYVESLWENTLHSVPHHRVYPVSVTKNGLKLSVKIAKTNFIRIHEIDNIADRQDTLLRNVLHECSRQLKQIESKTLTDKAKAPPPVKLFLSHAKQDGVPIAQGIREWLLKDNILDNFFDVKDIAPGYDFRAEIKAGIRDSALIICQTDAYTSRYYCRWEILTAKKYQVPTLIINALDTGEERSFPYLGNAPTLRWQGNETISIIMTKILLEVLRYRYFPGYVETLKQIGRVPSQAIVIPCAPELLNQVQARQTNQLQPDTLLIYPDPPLGDDEIGVIKALNPGIKAWTPSQPTPQETGVQQQKPLSGKTIGISISESSDLQRLGFSAVHQQRALIEISRHLLAQGASVAYGGDLRPGGFTLDLVEMVKAYNEEATERAEKILNFLAWPLHLNLTVEWQANYKHEVSIQAISLPQDLKQPPFSIDETTYLEPNSRLNRYIWARCLTAMREQMAERIDARIILGGKVTGYKGAVPGIVEEAALAIFHHKPLFVLGAFGGCARAVGEALMGESPEVLTQAYQTAQSKDYGDLLEFYNQQATQSGFLPSIDYTRLVTTLEERGFQGLNNGLTELENQNLFNTENLEEMVYLILKGLETKHE
jgi:SLOG cluster2/TIR domain